MAPLIIFGSEKIKYGFPPLKDSNSFSTVDYDAHNKTKIHHSIEHLSISMIIEELETWYPICEQEKTRLRINLAMSVQNLRLICYIFLRNSSHNLYLDSLVAWLHDCRQDLPPLYETDKSFDPLLKYDQDSVKYIDPRLKQFFEQPTLLSLIAIHKLI